MMCPNCNVQLVMSERQGIEIDYCPACRGVWLDRGELDKIIERSELLEKIPSYNPHNHLSDDKDYNMYEYPRYEYSKHKKRGLLGELFD
jgi:uncharacterized protein